MIKNFKPTSPGIRHRVVVKDTAIEVTDLNLGKHLQKRKSRTGGRNNLGKITMRFRGGGHKKKVRRIDYEYKKGQYSESTVVQIEYSPQMGGNLALCATPNHEFFYRIATKNLKVKDIFKGQYINSDIPKEGDVRFLKDIPQGRHIHSLEMLPGQGATLARSAGSFATLLSHNPSKNGKEGKTLVLLPSKKTITLRDTCLATIGQVGNEKHFMKRRGKAGASRWEGIRPRTRGEAMNPVDHPHGGKTHSTGGKGKPMKNLWGKLAKFAS